MTASIAWPRFHACRWDGRSTIRWQHRLKREHPTGTERNRIAHKECGWKGGDSGTDSAEKEPCPTKNKTNPLDSDRPSHGRRLRSSTRALRLALKTLICVDQRSSAEAQSPASSLTIAAISSTAFGCASDFAASAIRPRRLGSLSRAAIVSTR